jgi:hypothetical protein
MFITLRRGFMVFNIKTGESMGILKGKHEFEKIENLSKKYLVLKDTSIGQSENFWRSFSLAVCPGLGVLQVIIEE